MKKIFVASLLALSVNAQAGTVTFNDNPDYTYHSGPVSSGELTFAPVSGDHWTYSANPGSYNGTIAYIAGYNGGGEGAFSFYETNNSAFSLNSLDVGTTHGADWYNAGIGSVTFTGHQAGGGTLTQTLALNFSYANYVFNWANLLSVDVSGNSNFGFVAFDNITVNAAPVNPVPVPAAVWLFGSALAGLVGFGKSKRGNVLTT